MNLHSFNPYEEVLQRSAESAVTVSPKKYGFWSGVFATIFVMGVIYLITDIRKDMPKKKKQTSS